MPSTPCPARSTSSRAFRWSSSASISMSGGRTSERRDRTMKTVGVKSALLAGLLALGCAAVDRGNAATPADTVSQRDVAAKLAYCEVCHGVDAQGFHGYYPIPRLAGQQTDYLKNQLQAFSERRRTNNIMFNV